MSHVNGTLATVLQCHEGLGGAALKVVAASPVIQQAVSATGMSAGTAVLGVSRRVGEEMSKLLSLRVADILTHGWSTYRELQKFNDPLQYPADETVTCMLGEHQMDFTDTPTVEITVAANPPRSFEVKFNLALHAELTGVVLTIQDRKVIRAEVGKCDLSATLHLGAAELLKKELGQYSLKETIEIPGGMPITSNSGRG
jgi:hypothetical protein